MNKNIYAYKVKRRGRWGEIGTVVTGRPIERVEKLISHLNSGCQKVYVWQAGSII